MVKYDFKKEKKNLYYPSEKLVSVVDVPRMNFLMIDGQGDPNTSQEYQDAMETLFPVSYKTKFLSKKQNNQDYVVMPLEGLWWAENMEEFSIEDKGSWKWTVMIMQPEFITQELISMAIEDVESKKNLASISKVRFEKFSERLAAQIMHIGPYGAAEALTVEKLHDFIYKSGYKIRDKHHEIYISDMRRTKPERLKTVIRQPIEQK
ncbi:GyrI-like domain-containing protein [Methanobacterium spitsbergense]|uniref:GyrI-like domain-containing protein n=1 Tax=Methanobacterium spitsbergense TaxID=2874285 RepID=A0A8T5URH2_9EURY|nr:GyrI-like domain-containing protein [Methanobacterium spitsbergense]MBZ2164747.1 GyrI-like domain-containing protein [Methanobacterium spitsbergense]